MAPKVAIIKAKRPTAIPSPRIERTKSSSSTPMAEECTPLMGRVGTIRNNSQNVWFSLCISAMLGLTSGTLYGFGRYSRALQDLLGLSQIQVQRFGVLLDAGNFVNKPLAGYVYDHFGPRVCCLFGGLIVFLAYGSIHLEVNGHLQQLPFMAVFETAFFMVGFGSGLGYIAALGSTTRNFQSTPNLGRAVGLVATGFGLSSTLVGITYNATGLGKFFLLWATFIAVVNFLGASFLTVVSEEKEDASDKPDIEENGEEGSTATIPVNFEYEDGSDAHSEAHFVLESEQGLEMILSWTTWKKLDFWLLFASFACSTGCGLFIINNVSTMVQSIGGQDFLAGNLVFLLSICNCCGRIGMGILADQPLLSKVDLFRGSLMLMAAALLVSAATGPGNASVALTVTVALTSLAYGGSWVLIVGILADWFGNVNFGKDYGLMVMAPALSGMIFNTASAWIYQQHTPADVTICTGLPCYRGAYMMTGTAAIGGCLLLSKFSNR